MADYTGPVMAPQYHSAWVQPDGAWRYVPNCDHHNVANYITGYTSDFPADVLESSGWLHISIDRDGFPRIHRPRRDVTQGQIDTLWDMLMLAPVNMRVYFLEDCRRLVPDFGDTE